MASSPPTDSRDLADYAGMVRRRWWVVLALTCLGALAAAAHLLMTPKTYIATTSVYVTTNAANANQLEGGRTMGAAVNMDNEAQVVQANAVAAPAAQILHSKLTPAQLVRQVSVRVPPNTTVLQISCSAHSAPGAAACAQAFATGYLQAREATAKSKLAAENSQLQKREAPLTQESIKLRSQARALPAGSWKRAKIGARLQDVDSQLAALATHISTLGASVNYTPGYVMTAAVAPSAPSSPKPLLILPSGLLAGLVIGLMAASVMDRRDDRIHAARDVERLLDLPVLFSLPQRRLAPQTSLVPPRSAAGRAFTELAEAVAAGLGDGHHVIVVAATSPGQAGSVVAANLAATVARTRSDTLLVCADLQDATTPRLLGTGDGRGLAEVLTGSATVAEVVRPVAEVARLQVITRGLNTTALANYLDHDFGQRLVTELRELARYVIIETRATEDGADTFGLAEFADAAIVVGEVSSTRRSRAARCVGRLDRMRTAVLGAAVLPAVRRSGRGQPHPPPPRQRTPITPGSQPRAEDKLEPQRTLATSAARLSEARPLPGITASAGDGMLSRAEDAADGSPGGI